MKDFKVCIVHANNGTAYYPRGHQRLKASLVHHGWAYDFYGWDTWPNKAVPTNWPWNIKASALYEVVEKKQAEVVIWLDASIWCVMNPNSFIDIVINRGLFTWVDGHKVGQTCGQHCLDYYGITRKDAHSINEVRSSVFGFDMRQPVGREFYEGFMKACKDGMFVGEKSVISQDLGGGQLFAHRQDQSVVSILRHKLSNKYPGYAVESLPGEYVQEYNRNIAKSVYWAMMGI